MTKADVPLPECVDSPFLHAADQSATHHIMKPPTAGGVSAKRHIDGVLRGPHGADSRVLPAVPDPAEAGQGKLQVRWDRPETARISDSVDTLRLGPTLYE